MEQKQKAINSACRMLGIREHSEKQIRVKLRAKGFDEIDIESAIIFLYEASWLSNDRFCESFIRSKINKGQGRVRIEHELYQHGVSKSIIEKYLNIDENNWQQVCDDVLKKKLASVIDTKNKVLDFKTKIKVERFLKYRGFEMAEIKRAFLNQDLS